MYKHRRDKMGCQAQSPKHGKLRDGDLKSSNVLLYIDNSNIFENAKKHSGHKKGYINGIPDIACRIDVGRLINRAVGNRELLTGKLYGSEPPALDSVWDAIRKKSIHVLTFERSKCTGKEKETDASLTADAVDDLWEQKEVAGPNRTLILFSGDRDLLPVVRKAIKHEYQVEIRSFDGPLNNSFRGLATSNPTKLQVFSIDDIFSEITFTKVVWGSKMIPRERSLITSICLPAQYDKNKFFADFVKKSCEIFKLPMMGKYLKDYQYILLVPCIKEIYQPKSVNQQQAATRTYNYYK